VLSAVPGLTNKVLSQFGQRASQRTRVNTFTEIVIEGDKSPAKDRPDGLVVVQRGNKQWLALIEAKIGKSKIGPDQIERYLRLAREHSIDALISISNEFVARPTHHPFSVSKALLKRVDWFHVSWTSILTDAILLHEDSEIDDPEQAFLIREFVRFFSHESAGVSGYTQMPPCWTSTVNTIKAGGVLKKNSDEVEEIVAGWHQEVRELSLQLSQYLSRKVSVWLTKKHASNQELRIREEAEVLSKRNTLDASFDVPDAASNILLSADLKARAIRVSMVLDAPRDKKTTKARLNWLLRQLKDADPEDVIVRVKWPTRAVDTDISLSDLREDLDRPEIVGSNTVPRAFEVVLNRAPGTRFAGRRTFVEELEFVCPTFYENIGQHLRSWQPSPPKPKTLEIGSEPEIGKIHPEKATRGNEHTTLLEIPEFLTRMKSATNPVVMAPDPPGIPVSLAG